MKKKIHTKAVSQHRVELGECDPYRVAFQDVGNVTQFPELKAMLTGKVACVAEGPGGFVQAILRAGSEHVDVMTLNSRQSPCMRVNDVNVHEHGRWNRRYMQVDGRPWIC
jgi:hypothetical protein